MDIEVTFADGTKELRSAESPCYPDHPLAPNIPAGFWPLTFATVGRLRGGVAWLWRETGPRVEGVPLTGEWVRGRVETQEEQIDRLTRERDAALDRIADLRRWATIERSTEETALRMAVAFDAAGTNHAARRESRAAAFDSVIRRIDGKI